MKPSKNGQIVKFSKPLDPGDETAQMVILEMRGDRALTQTLNTGMVIAPTGVYMVDELDVIDDVTNPKNPDDTQKVLNELKRIIRLFIESCDPQVTPQICRMSASPEGYATIEDAIIKKCMSSGMPVGSAMAEYDSELAEAYQ